MDGHPQRLVALAIAATTLASATAMSETAVAASSAAGAATQFARPYVAQVRAVVDLGDRALVLYSTTELVGRARPFGSPRMGLVIVRVDRRGNARAENGLGAPLGAPRGDPAGILQAVVPGGASAGANLVTVTPPAEYEFVATRRAAFVAVLSRHPLRLPAAGRTVAPGRRIVERGRMTVALERRPGAWVAIVAVGSRSDRQAILSSVDPAAIDRNLAYLPR